jgi:hypothetical protein
MALPFKNPRIFNMFLPTREWRNGRRAGLRIRCRKAWGFKSPLSQLLQIKPFSSVALIFWRSVRCVCGCSVALWLYRFADC